MMARRLDRCVARALHHVDRRARPRADPHGARAAGAGHDRLRPGRQSGVHLLRRAAHRRAARPRVAAHDRRGPRGRGSPLLLASRHRSRSASSGAAWRNVRAGRIIEGGSTITQQLARAAQLTPVRTYRAQDARGHDRRPARGALLESADPRGLSRTPSISATAITASRRRRAATSASRRPTCAARSGAARRARALAVERLAVRRLPSARVTRRNLVLRLMRDQRPHLRGGVSVASTAGHAGRIPSAAAAAFRREPPAASISRKKFAASWSRSSARQRAAGRPARLLDYDPGDAAAPPSAPSRRASRRSRNAEGRARSAGQPGRDGSGDRRRATRSSAAATSPRAASTARRRPAGRPAPRSSRSSTPRRSSAAMRRARCCATSTRRSTTRGRRGSRAASTSVRVHAAARPQDFEQPRRRAAAAAGG